MMDMRPQLERPTNAITKDKQTPLKKIVQTLMLGNQILNLLPRCIKFFYI